MKYKQEPELCRLHEPPLDLDIGVWIREQENKFEYISYMLLQWHD